MTAIANDNRTADVICYGGNSCGVPATAVNDKRIILLKNL